MQKTRVRSLGQGDPLEKGMATHSSILDWRIPRGAGWVTAHGVAKSQTWQWLILPGSPSGFPYFLQFESEFFIKKLMIWAIVSSRSCFVLSQHNWIVLTAFTWPPTLQIFILSAFTCNVCWSSTQSNRKFRWMLVQLRNKFPRLLWVKCGSWRIHWYRGKHSICNFQSIS